MTSNVSYDDQRRCREAGMDDFQPKPMPPAALYAHLANVLGR